jgi:hypothetical protein
METESSQLIYTLGRAINATPHESVFGRVLFPRSSVCAAFERCRAGGFDESSVA